MHVEVTTGEGVTVKLQLPPSATVLMAKQEVESELGTRPRDACVFSINEAQTEKLQDEETLDSLWCSSDGAALMVQLRSVSADRGYRLPTVAYHKSCTMSASLFLEHHVDFIT
jgi:hypothetical protein